MPTGLDIGSMFAVMGVDMSPMKQAEQGLRQFDSVAQTTLSSAGSAASQCASNMLAIVGVTLSVAGAFAVAHKAATSWYSAISSGIDKVESFKKEMISTSYLLAAQSDVKPPDLSKAYTAWGNYYKWMYDQSMRADKAAASGMEDIMAVSTQLLKKGVVAKTPEQFDVIARLTDVMKGAVPAYASLAMQARGEIEAMLNGVQRMGAQTAMILSALDPKYKENMANARATRTELEYLNSLLPKIEQYNLDMMGTMDAVTSSMKSAWSVVQIKAFGDAHKEVVRFLGELGNRIVDNGKLTQQGERLALALGQAWSQAKVKITEAFDYILTNFPTIVESFGKAVSGTARFASTVISTIMTVTNWVKNNYELIKSLAELVIINKIVSWMVRLGAATIGAIANFEILGVSAGTTALATVALGKATTSQSVAAGVASVANATLTSTTIACTEATLAATIAQRGLASSGYLVMANAYGAVTGVRTLTGAVTLGGEAAATAAVSYGVLETVLGGIVLKLAALAAVGGIYGAYKTFTEPGQLTGPTASGDPFADIVAGARDKDVLAAKKAAFVGPPSPTAAQIQMQQLQDRLQTNLNAPPTPNIRPPGAKDEKGGKGGAGAADQAASRVQSIMETLDRELAKVYEGSMAESVAWANKMIGDLDKLQAKGADVSGAVPKVWQVALAKTQKLNDDFNKWYSGAIGDNYAKIKSEEDDKTKNFVMSHKTMEILAAQTGKSMVDLVA
ncbi:MAG: hypothetical protein PHQ43_14985, partial [Dehalococcoidales bacterium]|nr:hypothetical protein [Dehalococcoidales bacterium]